jgi:predicted AlkP superfamily phosphohydrolase/phosphomutase
MYTNMEVVETLDLKNTARSRSRLQQNDNAVESQQDKEDGVDIIVTDAAPSISASATPGHPSISINPTKTFDEDAKHICEAFYGFLFPRIAPMRWTTFTILSISTAIP